MFFGKRLKRKYREKLKKIKNRYSKRIGDEQNKYISILSHEIKTPLLAQKRSLELLLEGKFDRVENKQKEILEEIIASNDFLLDVAYNAIFLAKYDNEQPQLNLEKINIVEQIEDACEAIKNQAANKQQNIIFHPGETKEIKLEADRKLIKKIITNLLSGCASCGFENSDIEISVFENNNSISFLAKNKSIYMTKEKINSLFEEKENLRDFNQLGMNLNLNIAKKLIKAHNWNIVATSDTDNSSTFGFVVKK